MAVIETARFPRLSRARNSAVNSFDDFGDHALFFWRALVATPRALTQYPKETLRLIAEIAMGTGALAMIGGTLATGGVIAVQGFSSLTDVGVEALTGFFAAFINVRIAAPVIAGIGLAATIGAGATAQLGAMRVSEEIDALEVMAIDSITYLVSTRIVAGMIAVVPLYSLAVIASFLASRFATVEIYGQSGGVYDHYFSTFLIPTDILWSFVQAIAMAITIMLIHTYHGYNAAGGPAGVGSAVGNAVRTSLIAVVTVTLLVSLAIYGGDGNFNLSG